MFSRIIAIVFVVLAVVSVGFSSSHRPEGRIVGGEDATNVSIPWMVSLVNYGVHHCGGAIINKKTIITAAHCVAFLNLHRTKIRAGSKFASSEGVLVPVEHVEMHDKFNIATMDYDIGLIRLKEDLAFNEDIQPISVPKADFTLNNGTTALVSGWGFLTPEGPVSEILQYLIVNYFDRQYCNKLMRNKITQRMICAGRLEGGHDACQMDSGGPLVANDTLIGVVSWGVGCAAPNYPGVYTDVAAFRQWIEEKLAKYGDKID